MSDNNSSQANDFSKYGIYTIIDSQELVFPNTQIKFEKVSQKAFSYARMDSEGKILEKMIPTESDQIVIEVCPIRPLNYPARRTNYVYLQFDRDIFLVGNTTAAVFVQCPIEIGLFLIHDGHKDSLDWFTCDPHNSRFGLYGQPDSGTLCKYSEIQIVGSSDESVPYVNGVMRILLKNEIDNGRAINKIVFPITDNSVYYENNKAIFDNLDAIIKKRGRTEYVDVNHSKIDTTWNLSPTLEITTVNTPMEMGLD